MLQTKDGLPLSKDKIIGAAATVFSELGYYRASMDEIAKVANVAKGTLYYHFPSKASLFKAVVTDGMHMLTTQVQQDLDPGLSESEQIKRILETNINFYLQFSEMSNIFFNEMSSGIDADILDELKLLRSNYIKFIADILQVGQTEGSIRPFHAEMATAGILAMLDGFCQYYLEHQETVSREQVVELMYTIVSQGIVDNNKTTSNGKC